MVSLSLNKEWLGKIKITEYEECGMILNVYIRYDNARIYYIWYYRLIIRRGEVI